MRVLLVVGAVLMAGSWLLALGLCSASAARERAHRRLHRRIGRRSRRGPSVGGFPSPRASELRSALDPARTSTRGGGSGAA